MLIGLIPFTVLNCIGAQYENRVIIIPEKNIKMDHFFNRCNSLLLSIQINTVIVRTVVFQLSFIGVAHFYILS